jgi:hypothetical protein
MLEDDEVMVGITYWSSCSDHEGEQRHLRCLLGQSWARSLALGGWANNLCKPELVCIDCYHRLRCRALHACVYSLIFKLSNGYYRMPGLCRNAD